MSAAAKDLATQPHFIASLPFIQEGKYIDHTPVGALASGDVIVQGDLVGVTLRPISARELGSLAVDGAFDFTKNTGVAYTVGTILYRDDTNNVATTTSAGNKQIGKVVRAAGTTDTIARVRLTQ